MTITAERAGTDLCGPAGALVAWVPVKDGRRVIRHGDHRLTVSVEPDRLRIGEALAQLSAADRDVLRRSYYEGRTTAQIAHDLHIPDGTVKTTLHHAVRALQHTLQEMEVPNRWTNRPS